MPQELYNGRNSLIGGANQPPPPVLSCCHKALLFEGSISSTLEKHTPKGKTPKKAGDVTLLTKTARAIRNFANYRLAARKIAKHTVLIVAE